MRDDDRICKPLSPIFLQPPPTAPPKKHQPYDGTAPVVRLIMGNTLPPVLYPRCTRCLFSARAGDRISVSYAMAGVLHRLFLQQKRRHVPRIRVAAQPHSTAMSFPGFIICFGSHARLRLRISCNSSADVHRANSSRFL